MSEQDTQKDPSDASESQPSTGGDSETPSESADESKQKRSKWVLWGVVSVLVLAGVITLAAAFGPWSPDESEPATAEISVEDQSELLYQRALDAEASGDTTEAVKLLEKAVKLDPDNEAAKTRLEKLRAALDAQSGGQTTVTESSGSDGESSQGGDSPSTGDGDGDSPSQDGGDDPGAAPALPVPDDTAFLKKVDDMTVLLPELYGGYSLGTAVVGSTDVVKSGSPMKEDAAATRILWTAHDRETEKGAKAFVEQTSKTLYPKDAANVTVDGVKAYFGTDGRRFATVSFSRGRYAFEVTLTSISVPTKDLKNDAIAAAKAFPDSP